MSVVKFAEQEANDAALKGEQYDRIYCVFDRDGHVNYDDSLRIIGGLPNFFAIPSWPCFEIWVLLHFRFSTAPIERAGTLTACERAIKEIKGHFPEYAKGLVDVFDRLEPRLGDAIENGRRLQRHNEQNGSVNPATLIHELVHYLINLKAVG